MPFLPIPSGTVALNRDIAGQAGPTVGVRLDASGCVVTFLVISLAARQRPDEGGQRPQRLAVLPHRQAPLDKRKHRSDLLLRQPIDQVMKLFPHHAHGISVRPAGHGRPASAPRTAINCRTDVSLKAPFSTPRLIAGLATPVARCHGPSPRHRPRIGRRQVVDGDTQGTTRDAPRRLAPQRYNK